MESAPRSALSIIGSCVLFTLAFLFKTEAAAPTGEDFSKSMSLAMARMDQDMMKPLSGDVDRDFATMMIPHHQGAIDMAVAELRFGHNEILRRLAQGIIVEQQQEILVMRQALTAPPILDTNVASPMAMPMKTEQ